MITVETATDIALTYREIKAAEELLAEVEKTMRTHSLATDIRDASGRPVGGLQLGVPSGRDAHRLFQVDWNLAKPILQAHIANSKAKLLALNLKAAAEQATSSEASDAQG